MFTNYYKRIWWRIQMNIHVVEIYKAMYRGKGTEFPCPCQACHPPGTCIFHVLTIWKFPVLWGFLWRLHHIVKTDHWLISSLSLLPEGLGGGAESSKFLIITRWSTQKSDWLYSLQPKMEKLCTVSKNETGSWLWLRSWIPYCQIQTEIEESRENH